MNYFERAVNRTTGFGIVAGLSIVPGLLLGLVWAIADGTSAPLVLALGGPIAAALLSTPLHHLFAQAAKIPFSIIFIGPVLAAYVVFVKPAEWFALYRGWVVRVQRA